MKKIILTMAAVFAISFANAQDSKESSEGFAKGDLYLTGTAAFGSEKTGDAKVDGFTLAPGLGYFLSENLALEGQLMFNSGKDDDGAGNELKTTGFGIAAGVKYFWTPASKFSLSIGGNISYMSTKVDNGAGDATFKEIGVNVPVGLNYFLSDSFALTSTWGGLGYSSNDNGGNGADKTSGFSLGLDMSTINFGLIYKL
ncbi:outer membrane beta-barrel protein [Flavobacterium capsici]|uniref:Outer membrane beta-barrel protein n=1 Tax=Flavobacterium capsici TaxID=3075618 RepID=A0AA96J916_9FLAO|nr:MULTISPECIES: outer membrane beta-barrel protein [unclassified Flavobacterium]WNM19006.1 outer membrane beta-barrel protein [Flavobacterium sp. PMR2A8]WNM23056.1 outer membrane beta-barrel protein [Flavobacterium sp. PMTSA4]